MQLQIHGSPPAQLGSPKEVGDPCTMVEAKEHRKAVTFNLLNFWRERKPLQAAWSRIMFWDISFSRCFSSLETMPGFRKTWGQWMEIVHRQKCGLSPAFVQKEIRAFLLTVA